MATPAVRTAITHDLYLTLKENNKQSAES